MTFLALCKKKIYQRQVPTSGAQSPAGWGAAAYDAAYGEQNQDPGREGGRKGSWQLSALPESQLEPSRDAGR